MRGRNQMLILVVGLSMVGLGLGLIAGCSKPTDPWPEGKSPRILVSFPPLYCFAVNVAGDDAAVLSLLISAGPHDYTATALDAMKLNRADVFFINGLSLDDSFSKMLKNTGGHAKLRFVELGASLKNLIPMDSHAHEGHGHAHGEHDPHVWLGIPEAVHLVGRIRDELKAMNPSQAATYDKNAEAYIRRLQALQAEGKELLASKKSRKLVTFHESLAYFARSFDLVIVGSIEERAGVEPNAAKLAELVKKCKAEEVKVIAVEPQYPAGTAARTLQREVPGARTVTVDPIETAPADALTPDYYERKMWENLKNLADALP